MIFFRSIKKKRDVVQRTTCTMDVTLSAIDSRFVSKYSVSENEMAKLNNIKIKNVYSVPTIFSLN